MAFYLLTINKPNNSLISAKKKIRKISLFRFLIKQWRQHPGKGRYLPELPHRQHPQGMLFNMRVCFNKKYCSAPGRGIEDIILRNIAYTGEAPNMGIIASLFQPLCIAQSWREPNRI